MANSYFQQFWFSKIRMPVELISQSVIGASGAVVSSSGAGIASVTHKGTGVYEVKLQDTYYKFHRLQVSFYGPVTGAAVAGGAFVAGTLYQIQSLGSTTQAQWVAAGLPSGVTAAVGVPFVASAVGAGTGTVKALGKSGVAACEIAGDPQKTVTALAYPYFLFSCYDYAGALVDPASGSVMYVDAIFQNSSVDR